jgi:hypothetical protein
VRGPTGACSPTPLRGHKIGAILAHSLGWKAIPIYRGGAADAQPVGLLLRKLLLCRSWRCNAIASCPLAHESSSRVPSPPERHRFLPIVCQTPSSMSISYQSHRALPCWCLKRPLPCPSRIKLIASCSVVCRASPCMPSSHQRHHAMPIRVRNLIASAQLASPSSGHAHSRAQRCLERCEQPNQRLQRTALCAHKIVAILKAPFGSTAFSIWNAPPLKRIPLGRNHSRTAPSYPCSLDTMVQ